MRQRRHRHGRRTAVATLLSVAAFLALPAAEASAQPMAELFARANDAFYAGDHARAAAGYEALLDAGVDDPDVTFNLACAHASTGAWGRAIWQFERTLLLRPGDEDAARGLEKARGALGRRQARDRGEAMVETRPPFRQAVVRRFSVEMLAWLLASLNALFFGALILRRFTRAETARLFLAIAAPLLGLLVAVAALGLAFKIDAFEEGEAAIVLDEDVALHEGPDERTPLRVSGSEGTRARLLGREGTFARVRLATGAEGWANAASIGTLGPVPN